MGRNAEILKEILKLPANPRLELRSQLASEPKAIIHDYLPGMKAFDIICN